MPTFGQLNHVLLSHTPAWGHTWTCISVINGESLYRLTAKVGTTNTTYDFKFDGTSWIDVGSAAPMWFGTSETSSTVIVPDITHQYLYLWGNTGYTGFITKLENDGYGTTTTTTVIEEIPTNSGNSGPFAEILLLPTNQQTPLYSHIWRVTHQTAAPSTQTYYLDQNGATGISAATYIQVAAAAGSTANSYLTPGNSIWTIRNQNGVGGDLVTYPSKNKKVHSNFW